MNLPEGGMPSHWLVYFGTDDIDAANDQITASGGTVILPKMPVPGGETWPVIRRGRSSRSLPGVSTTDTSGAAGRAGC